MIANAQIIVDRTQIESLILQQHLSSEYERQRAIASLRELSGTDLENLLLEIVATEDAKLRCLVLEAFYRIEPYRGATFIVRFLQDEDEDVRYHASGLLGDCGNAMVVSALLARVQVDQSADVRALAIFSVGKLADTRVLEALYYIRDHDDGVIELGHTVKGSAESAIRRIEARERGEPDCCL